MHSIMKLCGLLALVGIAHGQAAELNLAKGKTLTDQNCIRCHGSEVYTRENRRVTSLPGLHKQVRRCEQMLGLTWFDDDIKNVAGHLNHQYYKFSPK
ncbi:MAG: cytochrome c [Gammaproteobacteria bacterium]|nr:cytochrome c [Gammaproteobacteria bacterium]